MSRFFFKISLIVLPVGLLVGLTNYFVDPANLFSGTVYLDGVARILSNGHNVDNLFNYNERILQEQMIKDIHKTPDVVILGSSRVMEIGSDFFPGKTVLNCAVSHANVKDVVAIIGAMDSLNRLPHDIIIGLDHYLLGQGGTVEWESLYPFYRHMVSKIAGADPSTLAHPQQNIFKKLIPLISLNYFKASIEFFLKKRTGKYTDVGLGRPTTAGRFSDGTICYSASYANPNFSKVAQDAAVTGAEIGIPAPDTGNVRLFENLIAYLQHKNIRLHFIKVPYHPVFYKAVVQNHENVIRDWQLVFDTIAGDYHVPVSGSFDADSLGLPVTDFYDMYHCSGTAIKKYIRIQ